ncbi:MAG: glycerol kinase GlpK, partial [Spirochaetaceae bacterium]
MTTDYLVAVDQSTSATKACLFDREARIVGRVTIEHKHYYPQPGWVEHDALEILANTRAALSGALERAGVKPGQVAAISVTNQRETVVAWDSETGIPVHHALVWQDERGTERCRQLLAGGEATSIQKKTGLVVDTYFSASKLQWLMDNSADCKRAAAAGTLMAGTMDTWVIWNLTNRRVFATDHSNASRTLLYNIETCAWDNELRSIFHASDVQLPEVRFADQPFGTTTIGDSSVEIPIYGVMGDSHAALFGHAGFSVGDAKTTFGTGSSVMMNVGPRMLTPPAGIVSSIAWGVNQTVSYVYEGNIHSTGDTMRWVRDQLGLFSSYADAEQRAAALEDNGGVYVVPAFSGLGAPHWVHGIRATISGLARSSTADHIIRAALESIAFQVHDVITTMSTGGGVSLPALRVDGGPTANRFLMQFLADILGVPVHVGEIEEISARGVAFAAGMATGFWQGPGDLATLASLAALVRPAATFSPS